MRAVPPHKGNGKEQTRIEPNDPAVVQDAIGLGSDARGSRGVGTSENVGGPEAGGGDKCDSGLSVIMSWQVNCRNAWICRLEAARKWPNCGQPVFWRSWRYLLANNDLPDPADVSGTPGSTVRPEGTRSAVRRHPNRNRCSLTILELLVQRTESNLYERLKIYNVRRCLDDGKTTERSSPLLLRLVSNCVVPTGTRFAQLR